jgi:hypothetical protein
MTSFADAPVDKERRRFRRARLVLSCVVTVTLIQIGWWMFFQVRASSREFDQQVSSARTPRPPTRCAGGASA